jgi:predicted nucleic acid-binding protein
VENGIQFVVPVLWPFEVANALLMLRRRKRLPPDEFERARTELDRLSPEIDDEGARFALSKVVNLADRYSLTIYDATYLELAIRRELPLASRDAALNRAARLCGVQTLL